MMMLFQRDSDRKQFYAPYNMHGDETGDALRSMLKRFPPYVAELLFRSIAALAGDDLVGTWFCVEVAVSLDET